MEWYKKYSNLKSTPTPHSHQGGKKKTEEGKGIVLALQNKPAGCVQPIGHRFVTPSNVESEKGF